MEDEEALARGGRGSPYYLGSSHSLRIELSPSTGLLTGATHYLMPGKAGRAELMEAILGPGGEPVKWAEPEEPTCEPTTRFVEERAITEEWAEELGERSPFPLEKGLNAYIIRCEGALSHEEGVVEVERVARALPGLEMGVLALDITITVRGAGGVAWRLHGLPEEPIHRPGERAVDAYAGAGLYLLLLYPEGAEAEVGEGRDGRFYISVRLREGRWSLKLYFMAVPERMEVDRSILILVPRGARNHEANLLLCASAFLSSCDKEPRFYAPVITYDEELLRREPKVYKGMKLMVAKERWKELVRHLASLMPEERIFELRRAMHLGALWALLARLMPMRVVISLIGVGGEGASERIRGALKELVERAFRRADIRFVSSEQEAREIAREWLGLGQGIEPISELEERALGLEGGDTAVLIGEDADDLTRLVAYAYALLRNAKVFMGPKWPPGLRDKIYGVMEKIDEGIRGLGGRMAKPSEERVEKDKEVRRLREELRKSRERLIEHVRRLLNGIADQLSGFERVAIFSDPMLPYEMAEPLRGKEAGFLPPGTADKVLLSALLAMSRAISPVPTVVFFDPQVRIRPEWSEGLWRALKEGAVEAGAKAFRLDREAATLSGLTWAAQSGCDLLAILTHGEEIRTGERLGEPAIEAFASLLPKRFIEASLWPYHQSFLLVVACHSWGPFSEAVALGMRGFVGSRWTVFGSPAVEAIGRGVAEGALMGRRLAPILARARVEGGAAEIEEELSKEAFFLVGPPELELSLPHKEAQEEPRGLSETLVRMVIVVRGLPDAWMRRPIALRLYELAEEHKASVALWDALALEMGTVLLNTDKMGSSALFAEAITSKSDYDKAWYNLANALDDLGLKMASSGAYMIAITCRSDDDNAWNNLLITSLELSAPSPEAAWALMPEVIGILGLLAEHWPHLFSLEPAQTAIIIGLPFALSSLASAGPEALSPVERKRPFNELRKERLEALAGELEEISALLSRGPAGRALSSVLLAMSAILRDLAPGQLAEPLEELPPPAEGLLEALTAERPDILGALRALGELGAWLSERPHERVRVLSALAEVGAIHIAGLLAS